MRPKDSPSLELAKEYNTMVYLRSSTDKIMTDEPQPIPVRIFREDIPEWMFANLVPLHTTGTGEQVWGIVIKDEERVK